VRVVVRSVIIFLKISVRLLVRRNFVAVSLLLCVLVLVSSIYISKSIGSNVLFG